MPSCKHHATAISNSAYHLACFFQIFHSILYTEELGAVSHLNTSFKHFIFFIWEYDLVAEAEQEALKEIISEIRMRHAAAFPNRSRSIGSNSGNEYNDEDSK